LKKKKSGDNLNDKHLAQLNEYFNNTNDSKIGILLRNVFEFYCRNNTGGTGLHPTPFYVFNWENIENTHLDKLAQFYATSIDIKNIIEKAQESFFMECFEEALFKELANPSRDFIKAIFVHMTGNRLTEVIEKQIKDLINSVSLKTALDKLILKNL
jgi:hypothetical protein